LIGNSVALFFMFFFCLFFVFCFSCCRPFAERCSHSERGFAPAALYRTAASPLLLAFPALRLHRPLVARPLCPPRSLLIDVHTRTRTDCRSRRRASTRQINTTRTVRLSRTSSVPLRRPTHSDDRVHTDRTGAAASSDPHDAAAVRRRSSRDAGIGRTRRCHRRSSRCRRSGRSGGRIEAAQRRRRARCPRLRLRRLVRRRCGRRCRRSSPRALGAAQHQSLQIRQHDADRRGHVRIGVDGARAQRDESGAQEDSKREEGRGQAARTRLRAAGACTRYSQVAIVTMATPC